MKTLMRSALTVLAVVLLVGSVQAAAPVGNSEFRQVADTMTIDSQHSVNWEFVDSMVIAKTDTCYTVYTVSGVAILDPGDVLYIGIEDGGGDYDAAAADTLVVLAHRWPPGGKSYVPFSFIYVDSLISQTDASDTIYVTAAVKGSAAWETVMIDNLHFTCEVVDID